MRWIIWVGIVGVIVGIANLYEEINWIWYLIGLLIGHVGQAIAGDKK